MNRDDMSDDMGDDMNRDDPTDAVFQDDLVLRIADLGTTRVRTLIGNDIGPAGICSLTLADGSTVHVDHAEPERLISVDPRGDAPVLDRLIGAERARLVRTAAPLGEDRGIRLPGRRDGRDLRAVSSRPRGGDDARALGVAAALVTVHHDEDELPLVRAIAGIELADRADDLVAARILDRADVAAVVDRSLDLALVEPTGIDLIGELGMKLAYEVHQFLDRAVRSTSHAEDARVVRLRQALDAAEIHRRRDSDELRRRLLRDMADDSDDLFGGRVAAMRAAVTSMPLRAFSPDMSAVELTPTVTMTSPGRLRIDWSTPPSGDWVRVLRAGSQVLLALAPIVSDDDGIWAETVVPPDLGVGDLVLDTVAAIDTGGVTPGTSVERVRAAVDLGRMAVAAAVARRREARELWRRCAEAWTELGDERRALRAMAYAHGDLEVTRRETLTDRVREVVDRP